MAAYTFRSPPGWPQPPEGWVPPAGWQPDPSWPPAPEGWQFFDEVPAGETGLKFDLSRPTKVQAPHQPPIRMAPEQVVKPGPWQRRWAITTLVTGVISVATFIVGNTTRSLMISEVTAGIFAIAIVVFLCAAIAWGVMASTKPGIRNRALSLRDDDEARARALAEMATRRSGEDRRRRG